MAISQFRGCPQVRHFSLVAREFLVPRFPNVQVPQFRIGPRLPGSLSPVSTQVIIKKPVQDINVLGFSRWHNWPFFVPLFVPCLLRTFLLFIAISRAQCFNKTNKQRTLFPTTCSGNLYWSYFSDHNIVDLSAFQQQGLVFILTFPIT